MANEVDIQPSLLEQIVETFLQAIRENTELDAESKTRLEQIVRNGHLTDVDRVISALKGPQGPSS